MAAVFFGSCSPPKERVLDVRSYGGQIFLHPGELLHKYHEEPDISAVTYDRYEGVSVKSNEDIEWLLQEWPDCEAIKVDYWYMYGPALPVIDSLSPKLGEFKKLKYLEIHSNRINHYPNELSKLTELEHLIVYTTGKAELEFDINALTKLKHLVVHGVTAPASISNLRNLESLIFYDTYAAQTTGFTKLTKLKELFIDNSAITLPDTTYNFPELQYVRLRSNAPPSLFDQKSITRLQFGGFYGDTLNMKDVSKLSDLEVLSVYGYKVFMNQLNLPKLNRLEIYSFEGDNIDLNVENLPVLESYMLHFNKKITHIGGFSNPNLRSITISLNSNLESIEIDTSRLKKLEEIMVFGSEKLMNFPDTINGVAVHK